MSEKTDREQVERDEADAEVRYRNGLVQAEEAARVMAADTRKYDEAQRAVAADTAAALRYVENSRQSAWDMQEPEVARKTFWQSVKAYFSSV